MIGLLFQVLSMLCFAETVLAKGCLTDMDCSEAEHKCLFFKCGQLCLSDRDCGIGVDYRCKFFQCEATELEFKAVKSTDDTALSGVPVDVSVDGIVKTLTTNLEGIVGPFTINNGASIEFYSKFAGFNEKSSIANQISNLYISNTGTVHVSHKFLPYVTLSWTEEEDLCLTVIRFTKTTVCTTYFDNQLGCIGQEQDQDSYGPGPEIITWWKDFEKYSYLIYAYTYDAQSPTLTISDGTPNVLQKSIPTTGSGFIWILGCFNGAEGFKSFALVNELTDTDPWPSYDGIDGIHGDTVAPPPTICPPPFPQP